MRHSEQRRAAGPLIVEALASHVRGEVVFWDIPDRNVGAVALASRHGFIRLRPLTRMYLGEKNSRPGDPEKQWPLTGPETG